MKILLTSNRIDLDIISLSVIIFAGYLSHPDFIFLYKNIGINESGITYILKSIPIIIFVIFLYRRNDILDKKFYIHYIFAFIYAVFDFNGSTNIDDFFSKFPSFIWKFSSIVIVIVSTINLSEKYKNHKWGIVPYLFIISGIILSIINFFEENFNINYFMIIGISMFLTRNFFYSIITLLIFLIYLFIIENRTGILLIILSFLCLMPMLRKLLSKFVAICFVFFLTFLFIVVEADNWFGNSILTGRASVWNYWYSILIDDILYLLFGLGAKSDIFYNAVIYGELLLGINYLGQFHSSLIATLVNGGLVLILVTFSYLIFLLKELDSSFFSSIIFYSNLGMISLNGNYDLFYPNIYGLIFLIALLIDKYNKKFEAK